jgi:hypothetical protein
VTRRPAPPSGQPPPETADLPDGTRIRVAPIAERVCERYAGEFPDEEERYGPAGQEWCVHDNRWLLAWAIRAAGGNLDLTAQVSWLARVLDSRAFPLDRLARDLDLAAEELTAAEPSGEHAADLLRAEAGRVRGAL